jgi:MFS family permease
LTTASVRHPHPVVFMLLCIPFGASGGYATVTLAYQLSQSGVGVGAIAALVAMNVFPQTYKVLWAPIVDTTLSSKTWYLISALVTAVTIGAMGFIHPDIKGVGLLTALVFVNSAAVSFLAMGAENLMANATRPEEKGRAGGWYQAGNLGGSGIGGGAALWIAQHSPIVWLPAVAMALLFVGCCCALFFLDEPSKEHRQLHYLHTLKGLALDVWNTAKSRVGFLALLICFLPIGAGSASGLWAAVAGDWHASADTVALVNGVMGGVVSLIGCIIGGYLCDRMERKFAYLLFGVFLSVAALAMAAMARTEMMFIVFTLLYAFVQGLNYASFSAVVLEAIGGGAAATKYNLYASLSNMPITYMVLVDGWGYERWHDNGLLVVDAVSGIIGVAIFAAVAAGTVRWANRSRPISAI